MVVFEIPPGGKFELVDSPGIGEKIKAYGTRPAVVAAANLICGFRGWREASIVDYAHRTEDKRVGEALDRAARELSSS